MLANCVCYVYWLAMLIASKYSNIESRVVAILLVLPLVIVEAIAMIIIGILLIPYMIFRSRWLLEDCPKYAEARMLFDGIYKEHTDEEEFEESE